MKRAINTTSPNMIKHYNGKDEDVFEYAVQNGYVPKEEDLINGYSLRRSKSIIKKAIEKDIKAIKYYEGNDEEVFKYAIDIDVNCLIYIDDDVVLTEELYRYAIDKDANCLNYIKVPLSEELYKYAVEEKGYKIDLSIVMNNNFFMNSLYMMKKAVDTDVNCIKNYRGSINSIFEYAVDKGYVPREEDFKRFGYIYNKDIMLKAIDNISPNMIKYYNGKDEEVFKYAIDKGYVPNKDDFLNNIFLTDSKVIMEKLISIDPEFIVFYKGDDISGLGELYFKTKNIDFLNMPIDKKRIFEELNNRMGNDKFYLACIYNIIFEVDNDLYKKIDINFLFLIIKFIYYSDDSKNLLVSIIKNNNFDNLMQIYNFYKRGRIDIDFLKNIVLVYNEISNLCNSIVNEDYTFDDLKMLGDIIVNGNGQKIKLNNIEDLRNYRENVYNNNINISKENDIYWMKNAIFLLLLNKNYHEIKDLFETLFSTYKIINLINNIKDENIKNELENYLVFMDLIEDIYNMNDIEFLRSILLKLNERYINADNDLKVIWKEFKNIEKKAKSFYGIEILEKATDFANINKQDGIIIESKRYKPTISDVNGEKLSTQNVDYIELDGISFVTFAHALNAYGNGAKINDFKHPRIIGKPYICLSAIDDEKYGVVDRNPIDVDHVTLLFSKISNNQLALAADHDIASYGKVNERDVKAYRNFEFKPVRDIISTTYGGQGGYNEYVMYREDDDGNYIYPSAILVVGDEPAESEINAAAYLGVPLVKINKSKYQKDSIIIENENTKEKNNSNKKMIDEYKDLRKAVEGIQQLLDNKELESIEEKGGIHR